MRQRGDVSANRQVGVHGRFSIMIMAVALLLASGFVVVWSPGVAAQDVYSEKTLEIARKLQCPVCAGQSVADSGSQLAGQMRDIIEQKVQAGESEAQILDFFVARYGDSILAEPPKSGFSLGLWWMPVVVVVLGAIVVTLFVRERTRMAPESSLVASGGRDADDEELEAIAREILGPPSGERISEA